VKRRGRFAASLATLLTLVASALSAQVPAPAPAAGTIVGEGVRVAFPPGVVVSPLTESNRAASAAAWEIVSWPALAIFQLPGVPEIGEAFVHTTTSIERFDATCRHRTGHLDDPRCFQGWRPHLADLRHERSALARREVSGLCREPERCHLETLADRHWIVETTPADWGDQVSYVTYADHVRLSLVFDLATVDPTDHAALAQRETLLDEAVDALEISGRGHR